MEELLALTAVALVGIILALLYFMARAGAPPKTSAPLLQPSPTRVHRLSTASGQSPGATPRSFPRRGGEGFYL